MKNKRRVILPTQHYEKTALSMLPSNCERVLDFGCGDGSFCGKLIAGVDEVYGCDVDKKLIKSAGATYKKVMFNLSKPNAKTLYADDFFDCIFMLGVLEHVPDEKAALKEMRRILKPGGYIIIFVVNKGLFGFFDFANVKFLFPRLHRMVYSLIFDKEKYKREFVEKRNNGMFGDFSMEKKWHSHYSASDLDKFLGEKFEPQNLEYFGLFMPFLYILQFLLVEILGRNFKLLEKLFEIDQKITSPRFSYLLLAKYKKV